VTGAMVTTSFKLSSPTASPSARQIGTPQDARKDKLHPGPGGSVTTVAFDALLDTARMATAAIRDGGGDKTSPSQMFESNTGDAHDQRQMTLKAQYRSGVSDTGDERRDSTSVHARRATASRNDGDTRLPMFGGRGHSSDLSTGKGGSSTDMDADRPCRIVDSLGSDRAARGEPSSVDGRSAFRASSSPNPVEAAIQQSSADAVSKAGYAADVLPIGASSGAQMQTPAQQVAQLLATGRVGEVESTRAAGSAPAMADGRSSGTDSKTTGRPTAGRQSHANPSLQLTEGAPDKADEAARSAFDRLVRSIRLHTGARQSSARLQLEPPELGRLYVDIRVDGDQVRINVRAETDAARDLVAQRVDRLTAALQLHGIYVERFDVTADGAGDGPDESDDSDASASEENANRERGECHESPASHANVVSIQDTGASLAWEAAPEATITSETRLDVRV